jgi:hypothetical protein
MKIEIEEIDRSTLPRIFKMKGANKIELFILKATRYGMQLIKADAIMLQLLAQH